MLRCHVGHCAGPNNHYVRVRGKIQQQFWKSREFQAIQGNLDCFRRQVFVYDERVRSTPCINAGKQYRPQARQHVYCFQRC